MNNNMQRLQQEHISVAKFYISGMGEVPRVVSSSILNKYCDRFWFGDDPDWLHFNQFSDIIEVEFFDIFQYEK